MMSLEFDVSVKNSSDPTYGSIILIITFTRHLQDKINTTLLPAILLTFVFFATMWMAPDTINDRVNLTATLSLISIKVLHDSSLSLGDIEYMTVSASQDFDCVESFS